MLTGRAGESEQVCDSDSRISSHVHVLGVHRSVGHVTGPAGTARRSFLDLSMEIDRKPRGRLDRRKADTAEVSRHGVIVRIEANARAYEVDVAHMRQRNVQTGRRRRVLCRGGRWFYDASKGSRGLRRPHEDRSHWEPYSEDVQKLLELAACELEKKKKDGTVASPRESSVRTEDFDLDATARALRRHGTPIVVDDARRAALIFGSMWLLRIVFARADFRLVGQPIYDRQYPKIGAGLNSEEHKACIRALLSRGMVLGKAAPQSKLLRKIEADALIAWERRCFEAIAVRVHLPDEVRSHIARYTGAT